MKKADYLKIALVLVLIPAIYFPVFYSTYVYTDECDQLWLYRPGTNFQMFTSQGRYITEKLFRFLFSSITKIADLKYLRIFSMVGWFVCIPFWYHVIKRMVDKEKLAPALAVLTVVCLITCPPFSISIYWTSCMELFLANTCGLLSGFILINGIRFEERRLILPGKYIFGSVCLGVISLFTYQNGFGCFFIPLLLHLIGRKKLTRQLVIGVAGYFFIVAVYYMLFKYNLRINHEVASARTDIHVDPLGKLQFFFDQPLRTAFHFSWLFYEQDTIGLVIYRIIFLAWIASCFFRSTRGEWLSTSKYVGMVLILLILVYLPGFIVKENYASNRTLMALDLCVFILFADALFWLVRSLKAQTIMTGALAAYFCCVAVYNFNSEFLMPVKSEYNTVRSFIEKGYSSKIKEVLFIRAPENTFRNKYGVTSSWDEFGVPSTFFDWVPEFFTKQIVFEQTGDWHGADRFRIRQWPDSASYSKAHPLLSDSTLLVDAGKLIRESNSVR